MSFKYVDTNSIICYNTTLTIGHSFWGDEQNFQELHYSSICVQLIFD